MSSKFYRPELDAIRFLAFFMVFLHHCFPRDPSQYQFSPKLAVLASSATNACGFGLPLFFFLSAYLISTLLLLEIETTGRLHFAAFYMRRILRIWPLYFLGVGIGVAWAALRHPAQIQAFGWYSVFLGNFYFVGDHQWSKNPMNPLWSISIEEQFYLLAPAVILLATRRFIDIAGVAVMGLSAAFLFFQGHQGYDSDRQIWANTLSQSMFFGAGMLCAKIRIEDFKIRLPYRATIAISAIALLIGSALFTQAKMLGHTNSGASVAIGYILVAVSCVLLLIAASGGDNSRGWPAPLLYLGKISYGLYVFHLLALMIVLHFLNSFHALSICLALLLTILVASVSYQCFERPILRLRSKFTYVVNRPV